MRGRLDQRINRKHAALPIHACAGDTVRAVGLKGDYDLIARSVGLARVRWAGFGVYGTSAQEIKVSVDDRHVNLSAPGRQTSARSPF
jgi:hypothetical protein